MNSVALDVSAASTGWAIWMDGDIRQKFDAPGWESFAKELDLTATSKNWRVIDGGASSIAHGAWRLKTEWTREGEPHATLHRKLAVLHKLAGFEHIFYERSLTPEQRGGASNAVNDILLELIGHVKSFHFAYHLRRLIGIHRASWQKDFIGSQPRGTKRKTLLELIEDRGRQLGFTFRKNDEAAAIGILTYGLLVSGVQPPWLAQEVLRQPLSAGAIR